MDTYSWLRAFADSWWLVAMTVFFLGQIIWTLRPGSGEIYRSIAEIPLRDDTLVGPAPCSGTCGECSAQSRTDFLTPEEKQK